MSSQVTFTTNTKGAFRVEVAGAAPTEVTRLLLTGHGDERGLELAEGPYTADVTNIGTGERYSFGFEVQESATESVIFVGADRVQRPTWRSAAGGSRNSGRRRWTEAQSGKAGFFASALPKSMRLRTRTASGWKPFAGTVMVSSEFPTTLKIVRSGAWSESPLVRLDFEGPEGRPAYCFVPMFSGGTLMRWCDRSLRLIAIGPSEPKSAAILGSLDNSLRNEAPKIVSWAAGSEEADAVQAIIHSREDPWIAAAAGLVLVGKTWSKNNGHSLSRLATRYPWIADLRVLSGWARAVEMPEDEAGCLGQLTTANDIGQVFFWQTFTIGDRLLAALASGSSSETARARARKELGRWKRRSSGAFKIGATPGWVTSGPVAPRA